jgi:hypothetical protein
MIRLPFLVLLLALVFFASKSAIFAELPTPQPAAPLFQDRPFGPRPDPTDTPPARKLDEDDEKPIPLSWIIGGACAVALATAVLLYGSARQWRSSNLFDRQYRFPVLPNPALRFGGKKCGGHLAQIHFGSDVMSSKRSEAKDA